MACPWPLQIQCQRSEKSPQRVKCRIAKWPSNPTLSKRTENRYHVTAHSSTSHSSRKAETVHASMIARADKRTTVYTMKYRSATKGTKSDHLLLRGRAWKACRVRSQARRLHVAGPTHTKYPGHVTEIGSRRAVAGPGAMGNEE